MTLRQFNERLTTYFVYIGYALIMLWIIDHYFAMMFGRHMWPRLAWEILCAYGDALLWQFGIRIR
jgi:hypothetical protein